MKSVRPAVVAAVCLSLAAGPLYAQSAAAPPQGQAGQAAKPAPTPQPLTPTEAPSQPLSPEMLERIREAIKRPPALKVENGQLKIYVEVIGNWPTFAQATKGYDLMNGPANGGPMSHQEFLGMVTPREMAGSGGVSAGEILTMAAVNYFGQKLIKMGLKKIGESKSDKEAQAIRDQIDRELAALRAGK